MTLPAACPAVMAPDWSARPLLETDRAGSAYLKTLRSLSTTLRTRRMPACGWPPMAEGWMSPRWPDRAAHGAARRWRWGAGRMTPALPIARSIARRRRLRLLDRDGFWPRPRLRRSCACWRRPCIGRDCDLSPPRRPRWRTRSTVIAAAGSGRCTADRRAARRQASGSRRARRVRDTVRAADGTSGIGRWRL